MIILGVILLVIGFLTKIAILWTIGIVVVVIGLILTPAVTMLTSASVTANIPAANLDRAKTFYAETLGLTPVVEVDNAGVLIYRTGAGRRSVCTRASTPARPVTPSPSSTSTTSRPRLAPCRRRALRSRPMTCRASADTASV